MTATIDSPQATTVNQPLWFLTNLSKVRLNAAASDGTLDVVESVGRRGEMPPLHLHQREDEYFVLLEGELTLYVPGESRRVGAGEAAFAPKGIPHTYRVESEEARWLAISSPSGFASFVAAVAEPAGSEELPPTDSPVGLERLEAAAEAHGIELLAPPGTLP
jgi:quercetin dioxygenase-like cupin family protein